MSLQPFCRFSALTVTLWLAPLWTGQAAATGGLCTDPPLVSEAAETEWRWIGVLPPGAASCPAPDATFCDPASAAGWGYGPLFNATARASYPPLAQFCLYEHTDPTVAVNVCPIVNLAVSGLDAVEPDRLSVTPQSAHLSALTWPDLRSHYESHVGKISLPVTGSGQGVRLALLDTSPTEGMNPQNLPESSPHGRTLTLLLEDLLCNDGDCVADVKTRLALAYKTVVLSNGQTVLSRDPVRGGLFGSLGDLAVAISEEHTAWIQSGTAQPLVLNLSLGWVGGPGAVPPNFNNMLPATKAVYRAIEAAACQGALVVAASGNRADERQPRLEGPLLPAAWAVRTLPANGFCAEGDQDATAGSGSNQLLYAGGGVRSDGSPLANAMDASSPIRVAYSDHVVIEDPARSGTPTSVLTGSSVATVVLSAAAAAVSYYRPGLSPAEVMTAIYQGGDQIGRHADFCAAEPCPVVSYVSLCGAVGEACAMGEESCPASLPSCPPRSFASPVLTADLSEFLPEAELAASELSATYSETTCAEACAPDPLPYYDPSYAAPAAPCPARQYYGSRREPWTDPQPHSDPCPNCLILGDTDGTASTLYVEIDEDYSGTLSDPTLTIGSGSEATTYSLNAAQDLTAGDTLQLTGLPADVGDTTTLSFTTPDADGEGTSSVTSTVLVAE